MAHESKPNSITWRHGSPQTDCCQQWREEAWAQGGPDKTGRRCSTDLEATGEDTGYATSFYEMDLPPGKGIPLHSHPYAEVFYVVMGHTDFLRVDEQGQEEWVRCGPGDTLVAPMNALHAFHNCTDKPSRFISSSVYYHEVFFETYAPTVDVDDPVPPKKEPTEAEGDQYLQLLKDAMRVHMYAPQASASSGLEVLRELEKRNSNTAAHA